jgi:hypothetical protein
MRHDELYVADLISHLFFDHMTECLLHPSIACPATTVSVEAPIPRRRDRN